MVAFRTLIAAGVIAVVFAKGPEPVSDIRFEAQPGEYTILDLPEYSQINVEGGEIMVLGCGWIEMRVTEPGAVHVYAGCARPPPPGEVRTTE